MNLLAQQTSPYLLQHKDNPVHWRPWGPEALAEAQAANKPILLSIGYAACHWCHVMAHESFESAEVAALMNEHFVTVKVDREERPDIDAIYQAALQAMGQQGGWPLTMFLTPGGEPFAGGTYFPPEPAMGRPGFKNVLTEVARVFREEPDKLERTRSGVIQALTQAWSTDRRGALQPQALNAVAQRLAQNVDLFRGGMVGAPKFPQTTVFEYLWRAYLGSGAIPYLNAVSVTLDHLCAGGIYDHLGGGFHRYTVDENWLVPHFEKMLYDNAMIVDLLTTVWQGLKRPNHARAISETCEFVLRELQLPDGGFGSSLDADSEGQEGKFYVWTEAEIDLALQGQRTDVFKAVYGVTPQGNWEGKTILHRLGSLGNLNPEAERLVTAQKIQLLRNRDRRTRPGFDDKVLADWNGLMIAALSRAAAVFERPTWHMAAVKAFHFVANAMQDGQGLFHSWRDGRTGAKGLAEDYANMARAALQLFEVTQDRAYLDKALAWTGVLDERFWVHDGGGYAHAEAGAADLIIRARSAVDNPTPSANGTMVEVHNELYALTGDSRHRERVNAIASAFAGDLPRVFGGMGTLLTGIDTAGRNAQVILIYAEGDARGHEMLRTVYGKSVPGRVLMVLRPGQRLPEGHPAHGKEQVQGRATAYVCAQNTCSLPITTPGKLAEALTLPPAPQQPRAANA